MALTKKIVIDKIETVEVQDHYVLQVRESVKIIESDNVISENYHRYILLPDADTSTISDSVVLTQFNEVMTDTVKENYQTFLASNKNRITE